MDTLINQHTHGPMEVYEAHYNSYVHTVKTDAYGNREPLCLASKEDAPLIAASYNAFDKAGPELGLDAAALARETDVAALIRFRTSVLAAMVKLSDSPKSFMSQIGNLIDDTEGCAPLLRG